MDVDDQGTKRQERDSDRGGDQSEESEWDGDGQQHKGRDSIYGAPHIELEAQRAQAQQHFVVGVCRDGEWRWKRGPFACEICGETPSGSGTRAASPP